MHACFFRYDSEIDGYSTVKLLIPSFFFAFEEEREERKIRSSESQKLFPTQSVNVQKKSLFFFFPPTVPSFCSNHSHLSITAIIKGFWGDLSGSSSVIDKMGPSLNGSLSTGPLPINPITILLSLILG